MTNEEAITFMDELKVCIEEHPIVADWLVEIADRKTENSSEFPNNCDGCKEGQEDCYGCPFVKRDEPQYDFGDYADRKTEILSEVPTVSDEPQTEREGE